MTLQDRCDCLYSTNEGTDTESVGEDSSSEMLLSIHGGIYNGYVYKLAFFFNFCVLGSFFKEIIILT